MDAETKAECLYGTSYIILMNLVVFISAVKKYNT